MLFRTEQETRAAERARLGRALVPAHKSVVAYLSKQNQVKEISSSVAAPR